MNSLKGNCGIKNFGNTCYLNAALQSFLKCDLLTNFIKNNDFDSDIFNEFKKIILGIENENCIISPISFLQCFAKMLDKYNYEFEINSQQDIREFITNFLDILHEEIKHQVNMTISGKIVNNLDKMAYNSMLEWKTFFKDNFSKVIDIFYGQTISKIKTIDNDNDIISYSYNPLNIFCLPIPIKGKINLYDCFDLFCEPEILSGDNKWKYDKDNKYYDVSKTLNIWKLPSILIIHLKRFDNFGNKITKFIDIPLNLDLEKYCVGYNKNNSKFKLFSICNQIGNLNSGHYYSFCKHNDLWLNFDDINVSLIEEKEIVTKNAYILFYKKC